MPKENLNENLDHFGKAGSTESADQNTEVVDSTASEAVSALGESVDLNARVSEKNKKGPSDKIKTSSVSKKSSSVASDINTKRSMPSTIRQQKAEIVEVIEYEILTLKKRIKKLQNGNDFAALSASVAEVRTLTSILKSLVRASVDSVKELWIKFVGEKK